MTTLTQMKAQKRALDAKIRAAEQAERRAAKAALQRAREALGVAVCEAHRLRDVESVERAAGLLAQSQIGDWLTQRLVPQNTSATGTGSAEEPTAYEAGSETGYAT